MIKKEDKYALGGISIGLSMNAIDYYQKVEFGADYETKISRDELLKQGKVMADKIVQQLREIEASYTDDQLVKMKITINTQFYGESEIIGFTQYVADKATTFLPPNIPIEITIGSINGTESFMARKTGETKFYTHIFN